MTENNLTGGQQIRELLDRVRARWRRVVLFRATVRAGLAASAVLVLAVLLTFWTPREALALSAIAVLALAFGVAAVAWGFWRTRRSPSDQQVARFIEEREPSLDDRLVSAVGVLQSSPESETPGLAGPMVADAARRVANVEPSAVVAGETLRRAGFQAVAAALLLAAIAFFSRDVARQSYDALALTLFPSRVTLEVTPGSVRIQPGTPLVVEARLKGNRAPVVARLLRADAAGVWRSQDMTTDPSGAFTLAVEPVGASFKYRVAAGLVTSSTFDVTVMRPPRVTRIDADYTYPASLGLAPRTEEDGGDIYAPAGTEVRLRVHTDREAAEGQLALADGNSITLTPETPDTLSATLKIAADGSYRVALADREGMKNPGDTEYFIRTVEDRPPDVRVLSPARDRTVTRLEEVDIEAEAEDDFGIDRLELVYAVRGSAERVVPLKIPGHAATVKGETTIYLEDLDVQPGDFVSYYVRARDLARGRRASEARSDIFFLEVKPFEQEFTLAESQGMGGGGGNRQIDDLAAAQKEIIVATWKLDRRAKAASGAKSADDIKSVGRAEAELKTRVEETSSSFRTSMMRDPRGRGAQPGRGGAPQPGRGGAPPPAAPRAGQTNSDEDAMTAAATAMGKAVDFLGGLKTSEALPPEMEALNHLLRAQADVKKREVTRQQAGAGGGGNRAGQDLSSLFDRELQRQQQTNYETPTSTEQRQDANANLLDKIKDLARRQDELVKRQRDLARERERMTAEELKRELEKLTREQSDLRQRAEDLAQQMGQKDQGSQGSQSSQNSQNSQSSQGSQSQKGSQSPQGSQSSRGSQGSQSAQGSPGSQGSQGSQSSQGSQGSQGSQQMRAASEEMRGAAGDLRRQDQAQAAERGARALERLREAERQLQASAPDEQRRARGDLQLEARQLADAQRQLEAQLGRTGRGEAARDALRRLAGEQDRLAERAQSLQQGLGRQAAEGGKAQEALTQASRDFSRDRVGERMQQSAEEMRGAAGQLDQTPQAGQSSQPSSAPGNGRQSAASTQREVARALDKLADRLASADGPRDEEGRRMSDQLGRAQELRERLEEITRELDQLGQQAGQAQAPGRSGSPGQGGPAGGREGSLERLREEYTRKLQETRELLEQVKREDNTFAQSGPGFTFEGQGMTLSAPGTEAFKQDFTRWEALRRQASQALERAEASLSQRLQANASRDRLAAGVDDKPPAGYEQQVDSYFKALATKKKP